MSLFAVLLFGLVMSQQRFPQMLEISTRPWLYSLSQKYSRSISKLSEIPSQEFKDIAAQGYDIVWMMGAWELGGYGLNYDRTNPGLLQHYAQVLPGYTQDDIIGSPYAVVNYTCNPSIGTDVDLAALKKLLNSLGLRLMLDFVPNHSAVDAIWTSNTKNYIREATNVPHDPNRFLPNGIAFGSDGYGGAWQDTAQFNYWDMNFRTTITEQVLKIASYSDYIRCDMAHLLLNNIIQNTWGSQLSFWGYTRPATEAWATIIGAVKAKYPNIKFLAEVYNPNQQALQGLGFDFTYDKTLYDHLGDGNLDNLRGYIRGMPLDFHQKSAHFVENHDEPRAAAFFGSNMRADAAAAVSMTLPGMRFYNEGQQNGYFNRIDVHLSASLTLTRRAMSETTNQGVLTYYTKLVKILQDKIFHDGTWTIKDVGNTNEAWRLLAWQWTLNDQKVLAVINYSDGQGFGPIVLPDAHPVNGSDNITVTELFTGTKYPRSAHELNTNGLYVVLDAWSVQMFLFV